MLQVIYFSDIGYKMVGWFHSPADEKLFFPGSEQQFCNAIDGAASLFWKCSSPQNDVRGIKISVYLSSGIFSERGALQVCLN